MVKQAFAVYRAVLFDKIGNYKCRGMGIINILSIPFSISDELLDGIWVYFLVSNIQHHTL